MKYLTIFLLFSTTISFSQTENDCIETIRKIEIERQGKGNSEVFIRESQLKIIIRKDQNGEEIKTVKSIDLSKVEKIIIEYNTDFKFFSPVILLSNNSYNLIETADGKVAFQSDKNRFEYYYFQNEGDAITIKRAFMQLAKLNGAKISK